MTTEEFLLRRAVVFGAALLYWAGVLVQARRIRRRIGRSPNLKPRNAKEKVLLLSWLLVIGSWLAQPLLLGHHLPSWWPAEASFFAPFSLVSGIVLTVAGYAATLWCYAIMGNTWRIGVNPAEKTTLVNRGPYRVIRHPIYMFQLLMLAGAALLLPTVVSAITLVVHYFSILAKAKDEEGYLLTVHGRAYGDYLARTGRFFPKLFPPPSQNR
ncbi:MAG: isoprenylcysteine carboxylmethyltransferase family protein [Verrucomicrobiae bacterium]|nr:isoprenylcysteine carboxylmethyltransferase family protein [Verrucomicrobiae bacterium]